ncbi:hypothetical protein CEXT_6001 [Caerostris extrusa]|uniref:Uncharacterized protein n=1 Tax=Caerostris extrusa TaxID=172846 RepID=A0AAV4TNK6_CAEEX|nr:hypothetical protein CEXT_6001 [Caerostris extrusa]
MIRSDPFRISPDLGVQRDRLMSSCHHANTCIVMNFSGQARDSVIQNRGSGCACLFFREWNFFTLREFQRTVHL